MDQDSTRQVLIEALAAVVIVIEVPVVAAFAVPTMVVVDSAAIAFPVACEVALSVMMRLHPACTRVHRTGPVSVMPSIVVAVRIPVASYPQIISAGAWGMNSQYAYRWRRPDSHSEGNLCEHGSHRQQQQKHQLLNHDLTPFVSIPWNVSFLACKLFRKAFALSLSITVKGKQHMFKTTIKIYNRCAYYAARISYLVSSRAVHIFMTVSSKISE